jgi:hypothetical protein
MTKRKSNGYDIMWGHSGKDVIVAGGGNDLIIGDGYAMLAAFDDLYELPGLCCS